MPSTPSLTSVDKVLAGIAGLASKSAKLSAAEKRELKALAVKGVKPRRQGFTVADRARCAWLIRKAGPESLPHVKIPLRLRRLLRLRESPGDGPPDRPPIRDASSVDPLDRLDKLAPLRERVLSEAQFEVQRAKILADREIGTFGVAEGADPLDRLSKVGELESSGTITADQAAQVTEQILVAS
jgi:hypothetical protein